MDLCSLPQGVEEIIHKGAFHRRLAIFIERGQFKICLLVTFQCVTQAKAVYNAAVFRLLYVIASWHSAVTRVTHTVCTNKDNRLLSHRITDCFPVPSGRQHSSVHLDNLTSQVSCLPTFKRYLEEFARSISKFGRYIYIARPEFNMLLDWRNHFRILQSWDMPKANQAETVPGKSHHRSLRLQQLINCEIRKPFMRFESAWVFSTYKITS